LKIELKNSLNKIKAIFFWQIFYFPGNFTVIHAKKLLNNYLNNSDHLIEGFRSKFKDQPELLMKEGKIKLRSGLIKK
jgi:hypothetical protein